MSTRPTRQRKTTAKLIAVIEPFAVAKPIFQFVQS
jgi:hypothetical protein